MKKYLITLLLFFLANCSLKKDHTPIQSQTIKKLEICIARLENIHTKLQPPKFGDWLYHHKETGQTFQEYLQKPNIPDEQRKILYIQPLGKFTNAQEKIIILTAEFMKIYFGLEVRTLNSLSLTTIPIHAQRMNWNTKQYLTTYIIFDLLAPLLPKDGFAIIALTAEDLWPGEDWNFVFGQAKLKQRAGVWSIYRYGNPDQDQKSFQLCLLRTLQTATHEMGHMFAMKHCVLYNCNMCGSNSIEESDEGNLWLCPECMAKICWANKYNPVERYQKLANFCRNNNFTKEEKFFLQSYKIICGIKF